MAHPKRKFCDASRAVALSSDGVGGRSGCNFRLGSVLVRSNTIIASGKNSYRFIFPLRFLYTYPFHHAESDAILKAGLWNCRGAILYVTRIKKDGSLGLARPCNSCQKLIELAEISQVIYSTENGYEVL